jgi:hypothetical protein
MKNLFLAFLIITFGMLSSVAQTPTPTPKNNDDDVVVINTSLIQIDVTVTDKKGKIVTDLKAEDFEIFENKDKQEITNFSFIQTQTDADSDSEFRQRRIKHSDSARKIKG